MKRKFYFAVVVLLVAVMALCLVACGETDDNLPSGNDTNNTDNAEKIDDDGGKITPPKDTRCTHSYGEWRVETLATCITDRVEKRICSKCGDREERTVSGTAGHTFGAWTVEIPATCGEDRTDSRVCTVCGYEEQQTIAHTATGRHEYNDANVCTVCTFYDYAFALEEKNIILKTTVDNSLATTCDETNPNVCENTEDNVFLLSKYEATLYITDVDSRFVQTTDYAKARGIATYDDNCCDWWLRSPDPTESKEYACVVAPTKYANWWLDECSYYYTTIGVVPVMWITL